jgi:Phosphotransferase enzyme family
VIAGLDDLLAGSGQLGLPELRSLLDDLLGGPGAAGRLVERGPVNGRVDRLRFQVNGRERSLVVKRLAPEVAQRSRLVAERWLPAVGLSQHGPPLLGGAAERGGRCVWHVYEDLGDWTLAGSDPEPRRVEAAVEAIARIHARFAGHTLLGECRLWGGDLGPGFYEASVRDAARSLEALRPPRVGLSPERLATRDRLLRRLYGLGEELASRAQLLAAFGGPETLLHGDLWTTNVLAYPCGAGLQVRLIDWDHVGVGPVFYDLSAFLTTSGAKDRPWILGHYRRAMGELGWRLPAPAELNRLFETAEYGRLANCVIWPAIAAWESQADWAFERLAALAEWFEALQPVLPLK